MIEIDTVSFWKMGRGGGKRGCDWRRVEFGARADGGGLVGGVDIKPRLLD